MNDHSQRTMATILKSAAAALLAAALQYWAIPAAGQLSDPLPSSMKSGWKTIFPAER